MVLCNIPISSVWQTLRNFILGQSIVYFWKYLNNQDITGRIEANMKKSIKNVTEMDLLRSIYTTVLPLINPHALILVILASHIKHSF